MVDAVNTGGRIFSIGNVLSRTFSVMRDAALAVFGVSFLFSAIPQAVWTFFLPGLMASGLASSAGIFLLGMFGATLAITLNMVVQGALVHITVGHGEERKVAIGEAIATGLRMLLPLVGLGILTWLGIMAGMVLLIVPGLILAVMWCVAAPALVDERTGIIGAFGRSRYLTKGARWKILGLLMIFLVILWIFVAVIALLGVTLNYSAATIAAGATPSMANIMFGLIFNTVFVAFGATLYTSMFVELRNWKDGLAPDNLAEVFA